MTEEEMAKIAFSEIIQAIEKVKDDYLQDYNIEFPNSITVNGNEYMFKKTYVLKGSILLQDPIITSAD